jgi:hypothetical protein
MTEMPLCYFEFRFVTAQKTWAVQFTPFHWQWAAFLHKEDRVVIAALGPFAATITENA